MAGSERISLYCLCKLLQTKKLLPFPLSRGNLYFYLGANPRELLCRERGTLLATLTPRPGSPASSHTKPNQNCPESNWKLWTLGGGQQGGIGVAGETLFGFDQQMLPAVPSNLKAVFQSSLLSWIILRFNNMLSFPPPQRYQRLTCL